MKKLFFAMAVLGLLLSFTSASAIEITLVGVVENGTIQVKGSYFASGGGGDKPNFETRYASNYFASGPSGISMENSFAGAISTKEQFEVKPTGFGRWVTKAGSSTLVLVTDDETGTVSGTLTENAIGVGGQISSGMTATSFTTATGLTGLSESIGTGRLNIGAIQEVTTGSKTKDGVVTGPLSVESFQKHFSFGPGAFQVKTAIIFPK